MRRPLLYALAGVMYVATLLTLAALFYFPVFLDSKASRTPAHGAPPAAAVALALAFGPVAVALRGRRWLDFASGVVPRGVAGTLGVALAEAWLWSIFVSWTPTGAVVWDAGAAWAGASYLAYWTTAGASAWALSARRGGLGYLSGCGAILDHASGRTPPEPRLDEASVFRYSRHPALLFLIASVWLTPLMTGDRLVWASIVTLEGIAAGEIEDRRMRERFGAAFDAYRRRVPKWIPFSYKLVRGRDTNP